MSWIKTKVSIGIESESHKSNTSHLRQGILKRSWNGQFIRKM